MLGRRPPRAQSPLHQDYRELCFYPAGAVAGHSRHFNRHNGGTVAVKPEREAGNRADAGAAAVEGAVIISVLLVLVLSSIECARMLWTYNTMLIATEQAGRYAMV